MSRRDPYRVLGVSPEASDADVKAAWRARLQAHHPDRAQQAGPRAVAAAEAHAKAINEAYAEIKARRDAGAGAPSAAPGEPRRATRVRRRKVQPDVPVDARDALRRAQVAVEYADTLCARWKRHAASIRAARKAAIEAAETSERAAERVDAVRHAAVAERDGLRAVIEAAAAGLAGAASEAADAAEAAAERAGRERDRARALDDARRHAARARAVAPDARALAARVQATWGRVRERAAAAEAAARGADREARIAGSAARRGRDAHNRARQAIKGLDQAVGDAGKAVERALAAAALAGGLSDADLASAADEQAQFIARRAVAEAARHRRGAEQLARDQQQVVDAVALVPERMAEIRGLAGRAETAARRARRDADVAQAAVGEAQALAGRVGPELVARLEAAIHRAAERAEAAAERAARAAG